MSSKPPHTPSPPSSRRSGTESSDSFLHDPPTPPSPPVPESEVRSGHTVDTTQTVGGAPGTALEQIFGPTTVFQVSIGVSSSLIEGETVVVDSLAYRFFRLNSSGSFIWKNIGLQLAFAKIAAEFQREYKLNEATALEIVTLFIADLVAAGLVVSSTSAEGDIVRMTNEDNKIRRSQ